MATAAPNIELPDIEAPVDRLDVIVVGGGQAGLSAGYYLKQNGTRFVILDANDRIGGSWRTRTWDSLRLFTPVRYNGLPGWPFPGPGWACPTARDAGDSPGCEPQRRRSPVLCGRK